MNGKELPWTDPLPVNWGYPTKTMFWDRVVHIIMNKKNTNYGCVPITTGAVIDKNRVLTSYNAFRELSRNGSLIDEITVQINTGRNRPHGNNGPHIVTWNLHELWSGRQVTYTPDNAVPNNTWHGHGPSRMSPLHDLMVLRVKPNFDIKYAFSRLKEHEYTFSKYASGKMNVHFYIFRMPIAKPGDLLLYPIRYSQLNMNKEKELQFFEFVQDDKFLVNCDDYVPKLWGHFICARNINKMKGVTSGALMVSKETVFGIGSFSIKRIDHDILVFTDVRPYHDLIMNAMTDGDTE